MDPIEEDVPAAPIIDTVNVKFSLVRANAIYAPDPDPRRLAATKDAREKRPGTVRTAFYVDPAGKPINLRISKKFSDRPVGSGFGSGPGIDHIVVETVRKWRFKPFLVNGKPKTTCSESHFDIFQDALSSII